MRLRRNKRSGFTLIEMIVVVAITVILLFLLNSPLLKSLQLTSRGQALVAGQNNIRTAMSRFNRELANAMEVHPRPINIWHYNQYDPNFTENPQPTPASVPERLVVNETCIDLVLPKHRYYCTRLRHHLLDTEISPLAALDSCPRHPGSPLELQPLEPLQPEPVWVRYFIGLRQPGYPVNPTPLPDDGPPPGQPGNTLPHYLNGWLFQAVTGNFQNTYVLYRAEFDPRDRAGPTRNWRLDATQAIDPTTGSGTPLADPAIPWVPNPNFFYDPAFFQAWKIRAVMVMSSDNSDAIRFVRTNDGSTWRPEPMIRAAPTPWPDDSPQPNRPVGVVTSAGGLDPGSIAPVEYTADYGHWMGLQNDLTIPVPPQLILSNTYPSGAPVADYRFGPHVRTYVSDGMGGRATAFDSAAGVRNRLFTYDSRRGVLSFAIHRARDRNRNDVGLGDVSDPLAWSADVEDGSRLPADPARRAFTIHLRDDVSMRNDQPLGGISNPLPASFGAAVTTMGGVTFIHVVPGSEVLQRVDNGIQLGEPLRRVGWSGISAVLDRYVAQAELGPDEYTIDYTTGVVTLSERDPSLLLLRPGAAEQLWVRYQFQTNTPEDAHRVSYSTRELMTVRMGVVHYSARGGEALPVQTSQKVRIRNMTR